MDPKETQKTSVFFGTFRRFLWRNEKTGASFFLVATKQQLLIDKMYSKKEVVKNKRKEDEVWFTMSCDGTKCHMRHLRMILKMYYLRFKTGIPQLASKIYGLQHPKNYQNQPNHVT